MTIGLVISNTPAYSETFFNSKIKGLKENGFKVVLFVSHNANNFNLCEVKLAPKIYKKNIVKQFLSFGIVYLKLLFSIKRVINFIKIEKLQGTNFSQILKKIYLNAHILSYNSRVDWLHFGFGTIAIGKENLAKSINAKMAVSFRGFDIGIYPLKNNNCYALLWEKVGKVHVISDDVLSLCYKNGMKKATDYKKITPAIDVNKFKTEHRNFITSDKVNFLTIGRLHWKKGYVDMLTALSKLKEKGYKFTYTIVGEGNDYERIAFAAKQLEVLDEIQFKGKLNQEFVIDEYKKADIYLQYSIQEGFCNAVIEAQSMGLLCVVSDAEGLSENVQNNKTGWVVSKHKPLALANKIIEVINLLDIEKKEISETAVKRVNNNFTLREQQHKFVKFYSE